MGRGYYIMAFPTGWERKQPITIDNTKVAGSSSLTDYPTLITLDHLDSTVVDAGTNSALNGGGDIRFSSDSVGVTQLPCEVIDFVTNATPGSRACEVWVKVPSVSNSVDTVVYIWYKNASETQPAVTATYGRNAVWSNYEAVWQLDSNGVDSSGNLSDGTLYGSPTFTDGGMNADGTDDYIDADFPANSLTNLSISAWQRRDVSAAWQTYSSKGSGSDDWWFGCHSSGGVRFDVGGTAVYSISMPIGSLAHVAGVFNGSTIKVFLDGIEEASVANTNSIGTATNHNLFISYGLASRFEGWAGWIRISDDVKTAGWFETEYNNQNSPATFATAGTPVTTLNPPIISNQACDFGAKTKITAGAYQLVNTGDGVDTIGTVTGTASTQYTVTVVSDEIVLTAKVSNPTAGTVIIADVTGLDATNIGSVTVTVSVIADAYSIASITEMKNAYDGSVLGEQLLTRDFWANPDSAREDFWAATALPSGTFNGSNHINITPHTGAVTKIGGIWLNASAGAGCRYVKFTGIIFTGDGSIQPMLCYVYQGASEIRFDTCHFEDSGGYDTSGDWVSAVGCNSDNSHTIELENCTFKYVGGLGNTLILRGSNCKLINNIVAIGVDTDFVQFVGISMNNLVITGNKIYVKYGFDGLDHGDFYQLNGSSLTEDASNLIFEENIMSRGQDVNELLDGQGLFMSNFGVYKLDGANIVNNEYVGTMLRGISVAGDNINIQYNTILYDIYADPSTAASTNSGIYLGLGDGCTVSNNVANLIDINVGATNVTQTNNQIADELTSGFSNSYDELFNSPTGGAALTMSNFIDSYKPKVSGLLDTNAISARDTSGVYRIPSAPISSCGALLGVGL